MTGFGFTAAPAHRRSRLSRLAAIALLVTLTLGSAGHFWHHLVDPHCGAETTRGAQPCATCSALHGAAVAVAATTVQNAPVTHVERVTPPASESFVALARCSSLSRAPPQA